MARKVKRCSRKNKTIKKEKGNRKRAVALLVAF